MIPARLRGVVLVAVIVGVPGWLVLQEWQRSGVSLPMPWPAAGSLLLLAVVVLYCGLDVRRWVQGRRPRRLDPLVAARSAVLAKAAAYTGGAFVGLYLAQGLVVLPDLVGNRVRLLLACVLAAVAAAALAVSGLLAQRWCRLPPDTSTTVDSRDSRDTPKAS